VNPCPRPSHAVNRTATPARPASKTLTLPHRTTPSPTPTPTPVGTPEFNSWFRSAVAEKVDTITVILVESTETGPHIAYQTESSSQRGWAREIRLIVEVYLVAIEHYDVGRLNATVVDTSGNEVGKWYCKREWAEQFKRDNDGQTLMSRVYRTFR